MRKNVMIDWTVRENMRADFTYCRIANFVEARIAGRQAASRYLKALVSIGVLREQAFGKEKLFIHPKLMNLLTRDSIAFESYRKGERG